MSNEIKDIEKQLSDLRTTIDTIRSIPNTVDVSITTADGKVSVPIPKSIRGHICYEVMREYRYMFDETLYKYKKLQPDNKRYFLIRISNAEMCITPHTSEVEAKNTMHNEYGTYCFDKEELTGCGDCWIREFDAYVDDINNDVKRRWVIVSEDELHTFKDVLAF